LQVVAFDRAGQRLREEDRPNARPREIVNLTVAPTKPHVAERRLEGRILLENGLPAEQITLRLYRRRFGGVAEKVSETKTRPYGLYTLLYDAGDGPASLEVRAVQTAERGEQEIPLSQPLHDLDDQERSVLNLVAPATLQPLAAEYRRLTDALTPHVGAMKALADAREDAERADVTLLSRVTHCDARPIALAVRAEQLCADAEVPLLPEAVYGLLRAGLPADKLLLAQVDTERVEKALQTVRDAGIVALSDQDIGRFQEQFRSFANAVRLNVPAPGSRTTYGQLLEASGAFADDPDGKTMRDRFADVYLNHRGDAAQLWEKARDQAGLSDAQIGRLQLQGKLAFLTANSDKLTSGLMQTQITDPVQLVEQDFYRAEAWVTPVLQQAGIPADHRNNLTDADRAQLDVLIPTAYVGARVEDRLQAYTADMARKVRLSYPTQVVARRMETDEKFKLPAGNSAVVALLKEAAHEGFRLGGLSLTAFLRKHPGIGANMPAREFETARQQVRTVQRIYQITPDDEAMPVLIGLGMTSAYDVMAYSEAEFAAAFDAKYLELYGKVPAREVALLVHRKARQVSSVTYNLFTIAKKLDSDVPIPALSGTPERYAEAKGKLKDALKDYPTLESLFGSMDFCACEHCRSVLSPAAYLVDLLQFLDVEPEVWDNFGKRWRTTHGGQDYPHQNPDGAALTPYEALLQRRPDLPYLPLTCENTNTALPYIDIVNEILEYYVAHGKLEEKAAHDTGSVTTAELLAEPQNVIREAYDKLHEVRYPLALPFDLWIETARRFCDYFETPLDRVLEVFRPGDDLFAPGQSFDRAGVFLESLGLSPAEAAVFTDGDPLAVWHELYGFTSAAQATTEAVDPNTGQRVDLNSAKALSRRLGVSYEEIAAIVQTGFVNPRLTELVFLDKLGVTIQDARFYQNHKLFYEQNQDLVGAERSELSRADRERFDDLSKTVANAPATGWEILAGVQAFAARLDELSTAFHVPWDELCLHIEQLPFDKILVLADLDAGGNFDLTTLQYADGTTKARPIDFLRLNLFVRLWRKLGWSIEETDRALSTFLPSSAPFDEDPSHLAQQPLQTALIYLAHLKTLDEKVKAGKQSRLKLLTLWSDIATTGKKSLYSQLFLTRSVRKSGEVEVVADGQRRSLSVFDEVLGQYLSPAGLKRIAEQVRHEVSLPEVKEAHKIDAAAFAAEPRVSLRYDALAEVQYLAYLGVLSDAEKARLAALSPSLELSQLLDAVQGKAREFTLIKGHVPALQGALGLTADEISRILADTGTSLDAAELSLHNISRLYRYGLLAKALKLSLRELISLRQLSGLDPFQSLYPEPLVTLTQDYPFSHTLRFIEVAEEVKGSGLKIEDLEYLLRHRFDETAKYRPDQEGTLVLLRTLAEGVRAIREEHALPNDPSALSAEVLRQKMGLVLPPDVVERLWGMVSGTAQFTATRTGVEEGDKLEPELFPDEGWMRELKYRGAPYQEQKLTFQGVLFEAQKAELQNRFAAGLTGPQRSVFAGLLDDVQQLARDFFDSRIRKQKLRLEGEAGFLDAGDFDMLFAPLKSLKKISPTETPQEVGDKLRENAETERENQITLQQRSYHLAQAFLPFLQQRLIRQFIVQTMAAHTGADPVLVESLLTDERLLAGPKPLVDMLAAASTRGITTTFFASDDGTGAALRVASLPDADTGGKDGDGNPLKPAGTNSARLEGYLEVPAAGAYRFYVALDKQNAEAELRFAHLLKPTLTGAAGNEGGEVGNGPEEYAELKPGLLYRFILDLRRLNGGAARLLVQGETLPKDRLAQLTLYSPAALDEAERAVLLLVKGLRLVQSLGLSAREIRYLLTHAADFGDLNLSELPTRYVADAPAQTAATVERFTRFLRLAAYARLKRDLAGGTDDLIGIFEANGTGEVAQVYPLIAKLTRRDETVVKASARALSAAPAFASEKPVQRLWDALQVVERFGVPVASLLEWTRIVSPAAAPAQRFAIACNLKEALKARFEPEAWQRVAQPIFDTLRRRQRDALVAHVLHQEGLARREQLYEYFLIDPGMEPVVQTSRIRLAISSVQLFIQRCLLNLEKHVHPSALVNARYWEWMKRYRVWEANRKIFLFPENWLEPEFRDDKTHLFRELEGALLQGDVSSDLVEDAFLNYLKKLDELARLEVVALHCEDKADPAQNTLHVIGRTHSGPHKYFYRRYAHEMWTPWEPVTAEIEGDHLAPVVWRDRLYLFWVTFRDKPDSAGAIEYSTGVKKLTEITLSEGVAGLKSAVRMKYVDVQLHWSEYLQGEWSAGGCGNFVPITTPVPPSPMQAAMEGMTDPGLVWYMPLRVRSDLDFQSVFLHVSKVYEASGEELGVALHLEGPDNLCFSLYLAGRNSTPERTDFVSAPANPYSSNTRYATRYSGSGALAVKFTRRITTEDGKPPADTVETSDILNQANQQTRNEYTLLPCNNDITLGNAEIASLVKPVFYQDNTYTLFIEPDLTERTLEEWEEWITRTPVPAWDKVKPEQWEQYIKPVIPEGKPPVLVDPEDPIWQRGVAPESLYELDGGQDWLVNPATVLRFGDELIGPTGRAGLEVRPARDAGDAMGKGGVPVNVHGGSSVEAGSVVIATAGNTLEKSGLAAAPGGLNVIGAGGWNSALKDNLDLFKSSNPNAVNRVDGPVRR
jgi:hypothetical protein